MSLNQVMFARESMWETMNHLANSEKVMFTHSSTAEIDLSNQLSLYSSKRVKRCEEITANLLEIERMMGEFDWPIQPYTKTAKEYMNSIDKYFLDTNVESSSVFEEKELEIWNKYQTLTGLVGSYNGILEQRIGLLEHLQAMAGIEEIVPVELTRQAQAQLGESGLSQQSRTSNIASIDKKFYMILGLIPTENLMKVHKLLFRVSRNNVMIRSKGLDQFEDPLITDVQNKQKTLVFIVIPRTEKEVIVEKVNTVLSYYDFVSLEIPHTAEKQEMLIKLRLDLDDNYKIVMETKNEINENLRFFSRRELGQDTSYINLLKLLIRREENFSRNLVFIDEKDGFYQLLIWLPESYKETLYDELDKIKFTDNTFTKPKIVEVREEDRSKKIKAPTYFKLNELTAPFQLIVDTYGVPRYQEANPGLFTIVSFPFLFGLMFGDVGHGLIVLMAGIYLCFFYKDKISILNSIKYLILFMGFFAVYCGLVYNEFFAVPFLTQSSCYEKSADGKEFSRKTDDCTYAFGMDWIWAQSENETAFVNSFKMKFSIIIGVVQMMFGILLKGLNGIHFNSMVDLWFESLPQFLFMAVTFGYMSFCIIIKWLTDWTGKNPVSIIQLFINFVSVDEPLYGTKELQEGLQISFVIICFVCIILMLVPKPLILHRQAMAAQEQSADNNLNSINANLIQEVS